MGKALDFLLPWDSQPQEVVELADWLPAGTLAYIGSTGQVLGASATTTTIDKAVTSAGIAGVPTAGSSRVEVGKVRQAQAGAFSVVAVVRRTSNLAIHYVGATVSTGTTYLEQLGINLGSTSTVNAGSVGFKIRDNAGNDRTAATNAVSIAINDAPAVVIARFLSSTTMDIWVNGVSQSIVYGLTGTSAPADQLTEFGLDILNRNLRGAHTEANVNNQVLLYARIPSCDIDISGLSANPWQLFAPRTIWVPVSAGGGGATSLILQDAAHAHAADNLGLTLDTYLALQDAAHAHAADNLAFTLDTYLAVQEAAHAHAADNLGLTLDTYLAVADALHAHLADNVVLSLAGSANLDVADAAHAHAADSLTLTLDTWLAIAEALHAHGAENVALTLASYLAVADALHAHAADGVTLTFPAGALSDAEFRQMFEWIEELHRIHGLRSGNPLTVTPTSRSVDTISQTIGTVGTTVTVTRT
jgi:uncharacterized protein (DUF934 family)